MDPAATALLRWVQPSCGVIPSSILSLRIVFSPPRFVLRSLNISVAIRGSIILTGPWKLCLPQAQMMAITGGGKLGWIAWCGPNDGCVS